MKAVLCHGNMCVEYTFNVIPVLNSFLILWASVTLVIWWRLLMYCGNHPTLIYIYRTSFRIFSPFPIIWNNRLCAYEGTTFITYSGNHSNLCANHLNQWNQKLSRNVSHTLTFLLFVFRLIWLVMHNFIHNQHKISVSRINWTKYLGSYILL